MNILITLEVEKSMLNSIMNSMAVPKELLNKIYSLNKRGIKLGLDNMHSAMSLMDLDLGKIKIAHIAGTNGKGSTAIILYNLIRSRCTNKKIGLYTSPHLIEFNERIVINEKQITDKDIGRISRSIFSKTKKIPLTFFEFTTLMAFIYFKEQGVEYAVIETGLGGRLDATNVVDPVVSIITSIGTDHTDYLGNSLENIAMEKAGIFKSKSKAVIANTSCTSLLKDEAIKKGLKTIYVMGDNFNYKVNDDGSFDFIKDGRTKNKSIIKPLKGDHQYKNTACALMALDLMGLKATHTDINKALQNVSWKGRLEELEIIGKKVILDVSHNEQGMLATAKFIKDKFRNKKIYTACGFMKDKKYKEMIDIIASFSDEIFLIPTKVEKRELKENDYMNVLKKYKDKATMCTDYSDCFKKIMKKDGIILFTGSIYNYEHIEKILRDVI